MQPLPTPALLRSSRRRHRRSAARFLGALLALGLPAGPVAAQTPNHVSFERDVLPIFRENCVECHGTAKQKGGLRLDRRSSAFKAFARRVVPGNSANSMVYERLTGPEFGNPMPPTGELRPEKIAIIKAWIEQGADWPESLSNEQDPPPLHPEAGLLIELVRTGDFAAFLRRVEAEPALLNARGPEGSTPFMYAVLYADPAFLGRLLRLGADPNRHNDAGATALHWAARDLAKTRLLVRHGADVNARTEDRRTPLMVAARKPGARSLVRFFLDHGADPNPNPKPVAESSPLMEALTSGDESVVDLLVQRGADAKAVGEFGLMLAITTKSERNLLLLASRITDTNTYTMALGLSAVLVNAAEARLLLDKGADVNGQDPFGRTPLMYAAIADTLPVDVVELLIARGADVNARSGHRRGGDTGLSVLDIARLNGDTPVVRALLKHGATGGPERPVPTKAKRQNTVRAAVEASLPLLQKADQGFARGAGCTSCHNNSIEGMALGLARRRGLRVDESIETAQVRVNAEELAAGRDRLHLGYYIGAVGDMFSDFVLGYQLLGLHARQHPGDLGTDAAAMHIQSRQHPDGSWPYPHADFRPPLCLDHIAQTALALRALQLYAPAPHKAKFAKSVRRAADWLAKEPADGNDDRAWRVLGLTWADRNHAATRKAVQELLASQRADGGWSDLPTMASTPYATGLSLVALQTAGVAATDPACQRGIRFLLQTQQEDGSWFTRTRALGFQPYFDAGFPHEYDQWMSAAGSSWATLALAMSLPEPGALATSR